MTFDDGMNHGGGWSPPEAAREYDRSLDEELGRERAEDLRERDILSGLSTASALRRHVLAGLASSNGSGAT